MSKASGSIDLKSLKVAGQTATNFLSVDNSGIMIYDGSNGTQTPSNPDVNTNNVFIDPDSLDIRKGTNVLATFSAEETRVGSYEGSNIMLSNRGIVAKKSDGSEYFNVGIIGNEQQYISQTASSYASSSITRYLSGSGALEEFKNLYDAIANGGAFGLRAVWTIAYKGSSTDTDYRYTAHKTCNYSHFAKGTSYTYKTMYQDLTEMQVAYHSGSNAYIDCYINSRVLNTDFPHGWRLYSVFFTIYATINTTAPAYSFGINTDVSKKLGFAIGNGTIPSEVGLAMGKYNEQDTNDDYVLIIGNGTSSTPSNALTVDWNGNMVIPNNSAYKSKNSSGDERRLCYITTADNNIYGYDSYNNNEGGSYLYGNTIGIYSKGNINIGRAADSNTININGTVSGSLNITGQYQRHGNTYIITDSASVDNKTVYGTSSSNDSYASFEIDAAKTGYDLIGVISYNFSNASSSGTNSSHIMCYGCSFDGTTDKVTVKVRNLTSANAKIKITVRCLYRAN